MFDEVLLVLRIADEAILYMSKGSDLCGQIGGCVELIDRIVMRSGHRSLRNQWKSGENQASAGECLHLLENAERGIRRGRRKSVDVSRGATAVPARLLSRKGCSGRGDARELV